MNFITGLFNENANDVGIPPRPKPQHLSGASTERKVRNCVATLAWDASPSPNHFAVKRFARVLVLVVSSRSTGYHEINFLGWRTVSHISWQETRHRRYR